MNRQQRRAQARNERVGMVNLNDITWPQQMSDAECAAMLANRFVMNLRETGHPFHHLTASGVIVEPDPTLEYYLGRCASEKRERIRQGWLAQVKSDAPKATPVNRK